jgi:hypothetical protein
VIVIGIAARRRNRRGACDVALALQACVSTVKRETLAADDTRTSGPAPPDACSRRQASVCVGACPVPARDEARARRQRPRRRPQRQTKAGASRRPDRTSLVRTKGGTRSRVGTSADRVPACRPTRQRPIRATCRAELVPASSSVGTSHGVAKWLPCVQLADWHGRDLRQAARVAEPLVADEVEGDRRGAA